MHTIRKKGRLKKKLRKKIGSRFDLEGAGVRAVVVCVGDKCAPREDARATLAAAQAHAARSGDPALRVVCFGCLKVCKKGPIVALLPEGDLYRRVSAAGVDAWLDALPIQSH